MSEEMENQQSTMDAMLDAIQQKNLALSRSHFDNLMQDKISDALEAEKVNIASTIYSQPTTTDDDLDLDLDLDDDFEDESEDWDDDIERDVEAAFEESDDEEELLQAELDELEV